MQMSRRTVQQEIIYSTVKSMTGHPSSDEVFTAVRSRYPSIGRATVYRVLKKLSENGELKKVTLPNTADRFDTRTDDHLHFRCTKCGKVYDVELDDASLIMRDINAIADIKDKTVNGNIVNRINFSFEGICSDCQKEQ